MPYGVDWPSSARLRHGGADLTRPLLEEAEALTQVTQLLVDARAALGQRRKLLRARGIPVDRGRNPVHLAVDPEPLAFERERGCIAVRQRSLEFGHGRSPAQQGVDTLQD